MPLLIKMMGIAIISDMGMQWCTDAGESAVAGKVELGGKLLIIIMVLPLTMDILQMVVKMLP